MSHEPLPAEWDVLLRLQTMQPVRLELSPFQALTLIGHLQLALRHPGNPGPSAALVRDIAEGLEQGLAWQDPEVGRLIAAGWDSRYDIPDDGEGVKH